MVRDRYQEDPFGITGPNRKHELDWGILSERHRILAFIVQARSRATGATSGIASEFNSTQQVNLDLSFSFSGIHSAQFLSDAASRSAYYQKLLRTFEITRYDDL
jgi:hypothetical protein